MNKSLTLIASAAVALSMFTTAAKADTMKTTADYKDLTDIDTTMKAKIDTLLSKGIFEGVASDSFGISQTMTRAQFAKVAALVFGLQVDNTIKTSSFSDVYASDSANGWAIPYIEAAKKAGLIDGMTDNTFAPEQNVTIGQLDTVLIKGLGKSVNVSTVPWYSDAVKQATALNIHPANKSGDAAADRADLVTGAYGSWQAVQSHKAQTQVSVSAVSASGDQTVLVTLDKSVDTSKASLSLSKDGTIIPTTLAWSGGNSSAALNLQADTKLTNGTYTVTLGGLDSSAIRTATGTFTIGTTSASGNINYTITGSYDLSNAIDSGLTSSATGTNGYATKAEAEDPLLSKFAKEVKFTATVNSGEEVALPGIIQSITSSNPSVVKAAVSSDHKGYILGNKAGTATVNMIYSPSNGENKQMSIQVQVKTDTVTANLIEARKSSFNQFMSVTSGVYSSQFNAYEQMDLKVTDNYGTEYEQNAIRQYNFALGIVFNPQDVVGDANAGAVGTVTVDLDGTVHITGNVTRFTLAAILFNGNRVYSDIIVIKN
jgi:hypothetical protein